MTGWPPIAIVKPPCILGAPLCPDDHAAYQHNAAAARAQLEEAAFAAVWADGRALPIEQAVAEALRVADEVMVQGAATFHEA